MNTVYIDQDDIMVQYGSVAYTPSKVRLPQISQANCSDSNEMDFSAFIVNAALFSFLGVLLSF